MARIANRMQEAVNRLMGRFQNHASVTVTYSRGETVVEGIMATVGRTPFEVEEGGVMVAYESRDYTIAAADLSGIVPAAGDRITEADGRVYEVAVPKPLNVFESIGPAGTVYKIHTKGIA